MGAEPKTLEEALASFPNSREWIEANKRLADVGWRLEQELWALANLLLKDLEHDEDLALRAEKTKAYLTMVGLMHAIVESFFPPGYVKKMRKISTRIRDLFDIKFGKVRRELSDEEIERFLMKR
jgi:hypothetical protein